MRTVGQDVVYGLEFFIWLQTRMHTYYPQLEENNKGPYE